MKIIWQRQKEKECWITSLSMITGKTLEELHAQFTEIAGMTYHEAKMLKESLLWWNTVNAMHRCYNLEGLEGSVFGNTVIDTPIPEGDTNKRYLVPGLLTGKGILCVHIIGKYAHAVAFENGEILDPEIEGRMYLKEWKRYYRLNVRKFTWRIDRMKETA